MQIPGLVADTSEGEQIGINDISFHRRHTGRVAELAYSVEGEQLGEVRCDGLVVATPAGSTGYNLANGGPGAGVGSGRVRRLVHRAAHAHRTRARGGAGRQAGGAGTGPRARTWR